MSSQNISQTDDQEFDEIEFSEMLQRRIDEAEELYEQEDLRENRR